MNYDDESGVAARSWSSPGTPDQVDRLLVAVGVALWLTALGAGVAAIVALVDLASSQSVASAESDTPWLLYTVIGVSAAVIVGAIPLLIRARRTASSESSFASTSAPRPNTGGSDDPVDEGPTVQRLQPFGAPVIRRNPIPPASSRIGFPTAAVDRVWLRCTVIIAGALGAATTAIGVGTYLLASGHDTAAWAMYALAGLITAATPVVPWYFLRELRSVLDPSDTV